MPPGLDNLKHVVVLMMSNRSFDHMLGALKAQDPRIDGLTGNESNPDPTDVAIKVQPIAQFQGELNPDPDHHFPSVDFQLFGGDSSATRVANMQGFVKSYFNQQRDVKHAQNVMHYFTPDKLPVLTTLAKEFAVFNCWFSSVPGPGRCNRAFAHYGTSFGRVTNDDVTLDGSYKSIFERMIEASPARTSKIYYYDAQSSTSLVSMLKKQPELFATYGQFLADCYKGTLPDYSFVEPNYTNHETEKGVELATDQHPDHHVQAGEIFIALVYNAIRQNPALWKSTALLITYDGHGGIYDHVAPPACTPDGFVAQPNDTGTGQSFRFDRLGARVPAVLVSPWIPKGTVVSGRVFEHASIPATLTNFFLGNYAPRTDRELSADTFLDLLTLNRIRTDAPGFGVPELPHSARVNMSESDEGLEIGVPATGTSEHSPLRPTIAGYRSDMASGEDLLGIMPEVETLCAVVAARDVEPPISIGLFGDWGSGKTFFMQQMQSEFNRIKIETRKAGPNTAYCAEIVQLWFNAWHYIDKNIWASLAAEIFEGLAAALAFDSSGENEKAAVEYKRAQLSAQTTTVKLELQDAIRKQSEAEVQLRANEDRLVKFETEAERLTDNRSYLKALVHGALGFVAAQPEVRDSIDKVRGNLEGELEKAAYVLNVPRDQATTKAFKGDLLELEGFIGRWQTLLLTLRYSKHRRAWAIYAACGIVAIATVPLLQVGAAWLSTRLATLLVAVVGIIVPAVHFFPLLNRAFTLIQEARDQSTKDIEREYQEQLDDVNAKHRQSRKAVEETRATAESKREELKQLEDDLEKLRADRQLADFIRQRKDSTDYKKHLGVIAQAYADFEQLSILLTKVRQELEGVRTEQSGAGSSVPNDGKKKLLPRIDRIVLYIDDLDRCPEDKVVEVLQAIHLLLFFPLFVVVVGVDSRWLLHSLQQQSRVFQAPMENSGASQAERAHWEATPLNYLEKIFQIPFAVRPMPLDGFRTLIDSLTEPQRTSGRLSTQTRQVTATSDVPGPATGSAGSRVNIVSSSGDQVAQPDKPAIADASINVVQERVFDPNPEYLRLSDFEREFMKVLLPLIPSPRAAKRFVNIYRLLRTTVTPNEMLSFVSEDKDGEYRAVQLLLAIQTGYPNQAVEIIRDLIEQNPTVSWWTFVDRYTEKYGQRSKRRSAEPTTRRSIPSHNPIASQVDSERWREFLDRLNLLRPELSERTCTDFIKWSPRIARYSFQSARVLQYATPRSASATQPSPPSGQTVVVVPLPPRSAIWE